MSIQKITEYEIDVKNTFQDPEMCIERISCPQYTQVSGRNEARVTHSDVYIWSGVPSKNLPQPAINCGHRKQTSCTMSKYALGKSPKSLAVGKC
jgi:hypothetical protein